MKYVITTKYAMKAKVTTIANGKVTNHRGFVDAETWIPGKIEFLKNIYKFDNCNGKLIVQHCQGREMVWKVQ